MVSGDNGDDDDFFLYRLSKWLKRHLLSCTQPQYDTTTENPDNLDLYQESYEWKDMNGKI
jgi:hypothetical protein